MTKLKDLISPVKSSAKSPQSEYAAMEHQPLNGKALPTKPKEPSVHSETTQYSNDSITGDTPTDLSSRNGSLGSIYEIPSANDEKKKGKLARLREKAKAESEKWKEKGEKWKAELSGDIAHTKAQMKQKMKKKKEEEDAPEVTVFGSTLEDAVRVSRIDEICPLPAVVIRSIEYLDTKGLNEVGLYRIPGSTTAVAKLKAIFDHGGDIDMILSEPDEDAIDPHNVATLLKMYFRELPEPVLTPNLNPHFTAAVPPVEAGITPSQNESIIATLANLASQLPQPNYFLLSWLTSHLARLSYYSDTNKMTVSNLALIFCPSMGITNGLFTRFVERCLDIFPLTDNGEKPEKMSASISGSLDILSQSMNSSTRNVGSGSISDSTGGSVELSNSNGSGIVLGGSQTTAVQQTATEVASTDFLKQNDSEKATPAVAQVVASERQSKPSRSNSVRKSIFSLGSLSRNQSTPNNAASSSPTKTSSPTTASPLSKQASSSFKSLPNPIPSKSSPGPAPVELSPEKKQVVASNENLQSSMSSELSKQFELISNSYKQSNPLSNGAGSYKGGSALNSGSPKNGNDATDNPFSDP